MTRSMYKSNDTLREIEILADKWVEWAVYGAPKITSRHFKLFVTDLERYMQVLGETPRVAVESPLIRAVLLIRIIGMYASLDNKIMPNAARRLAMRDVGCDVDVGAQIGPGLFLPHGKVIINGRTRIGKNCTLYQGVEIAKKFPFTPVEHREDGTVANIGNDVTLYSGVKVFGAVDIADGTTVKAGTVLIAKKTS